MKPVRMAQYGTKHGHAAGKLSALQRNPDVEFVGVYEPDSARRRALQRDSRYQGVHWFSDAHEMLNDSSIVAVASEGRNDESLPQTEEIVRAGKHVWYDKPAGDEWARWQRVVEMAREKELLIQMGYMFRYHEGFRRIAAWARSGLLGDIFAIRAHMSTNLTEEARRIIATHRGGIFYDLAGHMLDQIMWLLGRPIKVSRYLRHDDRMVPGFSDNTLVVFEWEEAMAYVDIAAMESRPMARRFEVYGKRGSAILEPFEPAGKVRLCLSEPAPDASDFSEGEQFVTVRTQSRQDLYDLELQSFVDTIRGNSEPDRSLEHELLVQETLLRGTGALA